MPTRGPQTSRLLAALPPRELEDISRDFERVRLDADRPLIHAHGPIRRVYFPESGLVALSVTMADGRTAGVSIVGSEGVVGLGAMIGELGRLDAAVLVPGVALAVPPERFRGALRRSEGLRIVLRQYGLAMLTHLAQTVACNRLHGLDQRAARWLLLAHDRIGSESFPLTQESFADLLGVSRPAVSTVGARFSRAGSAEFRRGTVHILDADRLEDASCECVEADREAFASSLVPTDQIVRGLHVAERQRRPLGVIRPEIRRA